MLRRALLLLIILLVAVAAAVYWFFSGDAIRRALEQQAAAYLGQPVRIARARAQLFPRVGVQLGDVRIGQPVRLTLAVVEVSTGLRALLSRRVEDAELTVADSRIDLPLPFSIPDQGTSANASGEGGGITIASVNAITLRNIRVASRGREIVVSASSSLSGPRLNLARFRATAGRTSLDASGIVDLEPGLDAKLKATANDLDLDDLLALADAFTPESQPARGKGGPLVAGRIAAQLTAARGRAAGLELRNLAGALVAQGTRVTLSPVSFELLGGKYQGAVNADLRNRMSVSVTSRIDNLDVAQLAEFGGVAGTVTGRLSGSGRFAGAGSDMAGVLAAASGNGSASIVDGTIQQLNLVRTVVLFFGRPSADAPPSQGDRFDRIDATFTLAHRLIQASSLTMKSPDADIQGNGTLAIPTKALDGRAELLLSESLSSQAGTDLVRFTREGNRVVLPATIGGSLEAPRIMIDAGAALKRGMRNEAERQLKGLLDRFKRPPQ